MTACCEEKSEEFTLIFFGMIVPTFVFRVKFLYWQEKKGTDTTLPEEEKCTAFPQTTVVSLMIVIQCLILFIFQILMGSLLSLKMVGWLIDWLDTLCHLPVLLFAAGLFLLTLCLRAACSLLEAGLASLSWGYTSASFRLLQTRTLLLLLLKILLVFPRDGGWTHMSSDNIASASSADAYLGFVNISQEWTGLGRGLGFKFPSYWVILILCGVFQNITQSRAASRGGIATPSRNSPQHGCYETLLEQGHPLGGSHTSLVWML